MVAIPCPRWRISINTTSYALRKLLQNPSVGAIWEEEEEEGWSGISCRNQLSHTRSIHCCPKLRGGRTSSILGFSEIGDSMISGR